MKKNTPEIRTVQVSYRQKTFEIEYFYRKGLQETILFVHGLGGAKENYWEACKSDMLATHTLIAFDNPGTGNSTYYEAMPLNVDDLTAITMLFIEALKLNSFILTGTSMGGLTTLLYLQRGGMHKVKAYINIEGNLMPEDCMFSSKVVTYGYDRFSKEVFDQTITGMKRHGNPGYHIIANNLELNTNVRSYYEYSFQTVQYSATGELLELYLSLPIPRIFIYGTENKHLSYIPKLVEQGMNVFEVPGSNHFVFYDNPKALYEGISTFVASLKY